MLTRKTVLVTADGKQFDNERSALEHVADVCREGLAKRLKPLMDAGHMTASEQFRVVMTLAPDAETVRQLAEELARMTLAGLED